MENNGVTPKTVAYNLMCQDINHFKLWLSNYINDNKICDHCLAGLIANLHFMLDDFIGEYEPHEEN